MFKSTGKIIVEPKFMFVSCDVNISRYYRWLANRMEIKLISQRHDSHISVIRTEELTENQILPKHLSGKEVEFVGNPEYMQCNATHYWFRIISPELEDIRTSFGFCNQPAEILNERIVTHPFHLTIGRINHVSHH